jgi:nitroimidazol reductase NimA-like FMN-containing flavoprotein (pyridoxamine 5'-phosphate oxidase superfamily)
MRRSDRQIIDEKRLREIIALCKVCRLGCVDDGKPYVVPLNFGYDWPEGGNPTLFFHGATEGHKLDVLRKNSAVCIEMDTNHQLVPADEAAKYGFAYSSIIGFGDALFVGDAAGKIAALERLMAHQINATLPTGAPSPQTGSLPRGAPWQFPPETLARVGIFKVTLTSFTGKERPIPQIPPKTGA